MKSHHALLSLLVSLLLSSLIICLSPNSRTIYVGWTEAIILSSRLGVEPYEGSHHLWIWWSKPYYTYSFNHTGTYVPVWLAYTTTPSGTEPNYHHSVQAVTFILCFVCDSYNFPGSYFCWFLHFNSALTCLNFQHSKFVEWCHWHWEYLDRLLQYELGSHKSSSLETNNISSVCSYLPPIPVQGWVFLHYYIDTHTTLHTVCQINFRSWYQLLYSLRTNAITLFDYTEFAETFCLDSPDQTEP